MTFQFGQDLEMDQLRTNHNISKILTAPSVKRGVVSTLRLESATTNQQVMTQKGGIADFSIVLDKPAQFSQSCNTSLNSRSNLK